MATPMKRAASQQSRTPSQQGHLAAVIPPVSTPFSITAHAFSPRAPRSSPRPMRKSPAAATPVVTPAATQSGPGLVPPLPMPGALNFDSPSAAAALGSLGIGGAIDIDNLSLAGLQALAGPLSVLGAEDEKLKKLDAIIALLNRTTGMVSEAGLEKLATKLKLGCLWEDTEHNGRKSRTLVIAGSALQLDIVLDNNIVLCVAVSFPLSAPTVIGHAGLAGQILYNDLRLEPGQSPLTKDIDKFAANLENLAVLDKLSIIPGLDCQEALVGLYESLERLYQWDLARLRADSTTANVSAAALAAKALCERHGRPVMHARQRVGLSLQYWMERRHVPPSSAATEPTVDNERVWSMLVGCASLGGRIITPLRISDGWIRLDVEADSVEAKLFDKLDLHWLDPPNTVMPSTLVPAHGDDNKALSLNIDLLHPGDSPLVGPTYPDVMFTATFEPPVLIPQAVLVQIHGMMATQPSVFPLSTYDEIVFPVDPTSSHAPGEPRTIVMERQVRIMVPKEQGLAREFLTRRHQITLFIYKSFYAQQLTDTPFSHPRQLVDLMPILRQYAFLRALLDNSFGLPAAAQRKGQESRDERTTESDDRVGGQITTLQDELSNYLDGTGAVNNHDMSIDIALTVHPLPRLQIVFPLHNATANLTLDIGLNGVVQIVSQNVVPETDSLPDEVGNEETGSGRAKSKLPSVQALAQLLEVFEDIGTWCEWIRVRTS